MLVTIVALACAMWTRADHIAIVLQPETLGLTARSLVTTELILCSHLLISDLISLFIFVNQQQAKRIRWLLVIARQQTAIRVVVMGNVSQVAQRLQSVSHIAVARAVILDSIAVPQQQ